MNNYPNTIARAFAVSLVAIIMVSCGGGSGAGVSENAPTSSGGSSSSVYTGPSARSNDVTNFRVYLWENLKATNRCGGCHVQGGQSPRFVRSDDVNLAYNEAQPLVNLGAPVNSRLVAKVGGGHNCWLPSAQACADIVEQYITNWANASGVGATQTIVLTPPPIRDPGDSKSFPVAPTDFASTVYPVLSANCSGCHAEDASVPQQPFFASSDVSAAYDAAKSKMDLDTPANSRFVLRLGSEFHNCWSDCASDATTMTNAIAAFSGTITATSVDPTLIISKALTLSEGIVATSGGRYETDLIAKYEFKTGSGNMAYDTSGVGTATDLMLHGTAGAYEWVGGWGVRLSGGYAQAGTDASSKLNDMIQLTGQYTIEAWVAPNNVTQEGPANIVAYSGGETRRNFVLGQTMYNYDFLNRSSATSADGNPALSTPDADEVLQATLQHVVATFDSVNGRCLYVNGQPAMTNHCDGSGGSLSDWDDQFALVLGNEPGAPNADHMWQGVVRMLAIHNRALTQPQIEQNFDVGVGQKFYLLFSVSHLTTVPDAYIVFEVSQFDSYSYLFNAPFFVSLDSSVGAVSIPIQGMRIGINGKLAAVGQAFANLDETITSSGQVLSSLGTIIALEQGPENDEFFISFENFDGNTKAFVEPAPAAPATPADIVGQSDIGMKTFAEINATMSEMTGVPTTEPNVQNLYNTVIQQLPTVENIRSFLSAHQMAISQMAIEYCNALVNDTTARATYFAGFNFGNTAQSAFDVTSRAQIIDPLLDRMLGINVATQPADVDVETELNALITRLQACGAGCDTTARTATIVKATCSATLGSAAMLLQ